ncbi:hypothetical protein HELRODRAFT_191080 [Helobdella robusta]|uniref:THUMP domain-containing protein n=1 Tax=Helobdella robusta TaxID=6412 RepID=T1FSK6_HELRO|nr:hypothetical protein HELRODRAFT_191080 [Helobdella robusta]ESO07170.1 hypothetical protein HELRODRAFT_191080 [Helobdella robusta]
MTSSSKLAFYFTCGRGTEVFVCAELRKSFIDYYTSNITNDITKDINYEGGKVFVSINATTDKKFHLYRLLTGMKFPERLFRLIVNVPIDKRIHSYKHAVWFLKSSLEKITVSDWTDTLLTSTTNGKNSDNGVDNDGDDDDENDNDDDEVKNDDEDDEKEECTKDDDDECELIIKKRKVSGKSFRVSAKCSGSISKLFDTNKLSSICGCKIVELTGWQVELRKPDVEISLQLNDKRFIVGTPVLNSLLSKRRYLKHIGLRSTIASIIASLCSLKVGMVVADVMCGYGTILVEAAMLCPGLILVGFDIDGEACNKMRDNIKESQRFKNCCSIDVHQCDVRYIPLKNGSVDRVVCDLPFGLKHDRTCSVEDILISVHKILKVGGRCVLLCGANMSNKFSKVVHDIFQCVLDGKNEKSPTKEKAVDYVMKLCWDSTTHVPNSNLDATAAEIDSLYSGPDIVDVAYKDATAASSPDANVVATATTVHHSDVDVFVSHRNLRDDKLLFPHYKSKWSNELFHYVKLGETHAYICVFTKIC